MRNIYSEVDLKRMGVSNIGDYLLTIEKLRSLYPDLEDALNRRNLSEELSNFFREYLKDCYPSLEDIKEAVNNVTFKKNCLILKNQLFQTSY